MTANHDLDEFGRTALHYAAVDGDTASVARLLEEGYLATLADKQGWTPLHFAAQARCALCCKLLIGAGAAVDPQDSHGNTPLWRAVFASRGDGSVITLLRQAGADPVRSNKHGVSPAKLARTIANYPVAQFFADVKSE